MPIIKIHNVETGEVIEREMTDEEIEQRETDQALEAIKAVEAKTKASEKAALLQRLGITKEEAKLLLS
jgi:hypothetical protein